MRRVFLLLGLLASAFAVAKDTTITFLHTNDLHAHVEETKTRDWTLGGYARQATLIAQRRKVDPNVVLLNAGDTFQGTLFFNVYLGLADLAFMNAVGYQAMALGNHEFDKGPAPLAEFAKHAQFPLISTNLDFSQEPSLRDRIKKSVVLIVGGQRVGIVSPVVDPLDTISSPGPTVKQLPMVASLQGEIDRLQGQGVGIIVMLSHIGFEEDRALVRRLRGVDLVIGGHSHTPLGTLNIPNLRTRGEYPTLANDAAGRRVPIVQAWDWGKLLGRIQVTFDAKGEVKSWTGQPIPITPSIPEDPKIAAMVAAFLKPIEATKNAPIGRLETALSRESVNGNNPMGQFIADSMLEATKKSGAVAAFMNGGGVRGPLEAGAITYGDMIGVQPFSNTLVTLEVTGAEFLAAMEQSNRGRNPILIPSRGVEITVNTAKPEGQRVVSVTIDGVAVEAEKTYVICLNSFIATGGDGFAMFRDAKGKRLDTGLVDVDATIEFFRARMPVRFEVEPRVKQISGLAGFLRSLGWAA